MYVLAPDKINVPVPDLVKPLPLIILAIVPVPLFVIVLVPAKLIPLFASMLIPLPRESVARFAILN